MNLSTPTPISWEQTLTSVWDVVIVGAGVAGGALACLLAERGIKTLVVDAKSLPRDKVCGGCLNQRAQHVLSAIGILDELRNLGACELNQIELRVNKQQARWAMPPMLSVRRATLDTLLMQTAISRGAAFLPKARAKVLNATDSIRRVELSHDGHKAIIDASIVIAADGLTQSSLKELDQFQSQTQSNSRIGVQFLVPLSGPEQSSHGTDAANPNSLSMPHTLTMMVSSHGYVGIAETDGRIADIAAAIEPHRIREGMTPAQIVHRIMNDCGYQCSVDLTKLDSLATPALTRRSLRVADTRLFLLGDSIGYVEPFTGEGMAWALAGAVSLAPIIAESLREWNPSHIDQWRSQLKNKIINHQWMCKTLSRATHSPSIAGLAVRVADLIPPLRRWAMNQVSGISLTQECQ